MSTIEDKTVEALEELPGVDGGLAVVMATAGHPPAMSLLSSGDILMRPPEVSVGVHASSSVVKRLEGAFTLLVPLGSLAVRVEAVDAKSTVSGPLASIKGTIASVRPTAEPPWELHIGFSPVQPDEPSIPAFVDYWRSVRSWLAGDLGEAPTPPAP